MSSLEQAEQQLINLADGDLERAELLVEALEEKRQQTTYIKYAPFVGDMWKFIEQLTPEQKTWVVVGGNRSLKSTLGCMVDAAFLLGKDYFRGEDAWEWVQHLPIPNRPTHVRTVCLNNDMLRDVWHEKFIDGGPHPPFFPTTEIIEKSENLMQVKFRNGSRWAGKSAETEPKRHGGVSCDLVHIDEECPRAIYEESYQRTVSSAGRVLITATPLDDIGVTANPWLYDLVEQWKDGDKTIGVVFMSALNNPYTDDEEKRKLVAKWKGHPEERARLYGEFIRRSGLFYPKWKASPPLWVPAYDLPMNKGYRVVSVDPASTGPVAAVWSYFDSKGKMTIYRTYRDAGKTASAHIEAILAENRGDPINLWIMDPWRGKQRQEGDLRRVIDIWRDAGLPRLRLADVDYDTCIEESREYLNAAIDPTYPHPPMEVFDHCEEFREEIEANLIDAIRQGPSKGESRDRPRKGFDDVLDAWRFTCGMKFRAPVHGRISPPPGTSNYFDTGVRSAPKAPMAWKEDPW